MKKKLLNFHSSKQLHSSIKKLKKKNAMEISIAAVPNCYFLSSENQKDNIAYNSISPIKKLSESADTH